jgi:hypothetical protein
MTQTHTENRDRWAKSGDHLPADSGILGSPRARRDDDGVHVERRDLINSDRIVPMY